MAEGRKRRDLWRPLVPELDRTTPHFLPLELQLILLHFIVTCSQQDDRERWKSITNCRLVCSTWNRLMHTEIVHHVPLLDLLNTSDQPLVNDAIDQYISKIVDPFAQTEFASTELGHVSQILEKIAKRGNFTGMQKFLDGGCPADQPLNKRVMLHWAIENGSIDCVRLLILRGCDIEARDRTHQMGVSLTPLAIAVREGQLQIVEELLAHGADASVFTIPKHFRIAFVHLMPLIACCAEQKSYHTMACLLEHDYQYNAVEHAAQVAIRDKDDAICRMLFRSAYSVEKSEQWLNWSIELGNLDLFEAVLDETPEVTGAAIKQSIQFDQEYMTRLLFERGARLDSSAFADFSLLHSLSNSPSHFGLLLDRQPELAQPALEYIVMDKGYHHALVRLCLRRGANANVVIKSIPLINSAIAKIDAFTCEALLKGGADPNPQVPQEHMPLYRALVDRQDQLVQLLIRYGATYDACPKAEELRDELFISILKA